MNENLNKKNWFGRNWAWAIPSLGCLTIIVAIVMLAGAIFTKVTGMFEDSIPYTLGMKTLKSNELVIEKLGEPIEVNGKIEGNIFLEDEKGSEDLLIPIKGPKGEATLLIIAEKYNNVWTYQKIEVTFEKDEEILNLLPLKTETN